MATELAYKTSDPEILEWLIAHREDHRKLHRRRQALARRITKKIGPGKNGTRQLFELRTWHGASFLTGVEATGSEWSKPPLGWRYDRSRKYLVPAKRSAEGREIDEELAKYAESAWLRKLAAWGVPLEFRGEMNEYAVSTTYFPGIGLAPGDDTVAYLVWGTGRVRSLMRKAPLFEEVPLEDYIALVETKKEKANV